MASGITPMRGADMEAGRKSRFRRCMLYDAKAMDGGLSESPRWDASIGLCMGARVAETVNLP